MVHPKQLSLSLSISSFRSYKTQQFPRHFQTFPTSSRNEHIISKKKEERRKKKEMQRAWSPENASKAYVGTLKSLGNNQESGVPELLSAMAAGWNSRLVVETWSRGGPTAISVGLAVASWCSGGRHVCVVPDEPSGSDYIRAMDTAGVSPHPEVIVGDAEEAMGDERLRGVDFLVVDCRGRDFGSVIRRAELCHGGAVVVCKNAGSEGGSGFRWRGVLDGRSLLVRSEFLPVGKGLDIAHLGVRSSKSSGEGKGRRRGTRWIQHVDEQTGDLHVMRC